MNVFLDNVDTETLVPTPSLAQAAVTDAATNSPALAPEGFNFGGRDFKLLNLSYEGYLEFTLFLQPLLEGVASKFLAAKGVSLPGIEIPELEGANSASYVLKFCRKGLPEIVCIVCNQNPGEKVTPEWVRKNATSPFQLAKIVMLQIGKNEMISEFADFFGQILPVVMMMSGQSQKT
jgi:hypothetical protein